MKKIIVMLCVTCLLLSGCSAKETEKTTESIEEKTQTVKYTEKDFVSLPDEGFAKQDTLNVTSIERDLDGRPAMYLLETGLDDTETPYAQVLQYSLSKKNNWDMKVICPESLTRLVKKAKGKSFTMPFILRGDDGNLYALLQSGTDSQQESTKYEYSVLQISENEDQVAETKLTLTSSTNSDIDYSKESVNKFHVFEDGTIFIVFDSGSAVQFDPDNGSQLAVCSSVPDSAFQKNVGYGEKDFIYYSVANKLLAVLDLDTMTTTDTFGDNIEESNRGREWYYDTHTEDWEMYAFNTSGLYRISEAGKKATATCLSEDGSFETLSTGNTIYDVVVDGDENVYALVRRKAQDGYSYDTQWDFGIVKFEK